MLARPFAKCRARQLVRALTRSQTSPVRRYVFTHTFADPVLAPYRAAHALDDQMVFHNWVFYTDQSFSVNNQELELASSMSRYWTRLAASGNPNGGDDPLWPVYDATRDTYLALDTPIS